MGGYEREHGEDMPDGKGNSTRAIQDDADIQIVQAQYRVLAVVVDERFLEGKKIIFSQKLQLKNKALFRSSVLTKYDIDNLYSELVLFNI